MIKKVKFIENGIANFKIVVKQDESSAEYFSALELQNFVFKSTGANIEISEICGENNIRFEIDQTLTEYLNGDGNIIKVSEKDIIIKSACTRGIIFGVYRFLEMYFGIKFIAVDCETIPLHKNVEIEVGSFIDRPSFALRSYLSGGLWFPKNEEIKYYLRLKQNNEHKDFADSKYGGRCPFWGRHGAHNMAYYVPMEKYGQTHPEFFWQHPTLKFWAIDLLNGITEDGKLDIDKEISVAKIVIEELKKDVLENPDVTYFTFEQADGDTIFPYKEGSKEEAVVKKYKRSGILIRFCNVVANEVAKWAKEELSRQIYLTTFAYSYTVEAPVKYEGGEIVPIDDTVKVSKNVIIRMAFSRNLAYNYFDERQYENLKKDLKEWKTVTNKMMFWGYDEDDVSYLWYIPTIRHIKDNVKGFKNFGVMYLMMQSSYNTKTDWQARLKAYIYSNLMWDETKDLKTLFDEYIDGYYGIISEEIKKVIALYENYSDFVKCNFKDYAVGTNPWNYRHPEMQSYALIERILNILHTAEVKLDKLDIEEKEKYKKRLDEVKITPLYMKINKTNYELYKCIDNVKMTRFNELQEVPVNTRTRFYNVESFSEEDAFDMPDYLREKINTLNANDISDKLTF